MPKSKLTIPNLQDEAKIFAQLTSSSPHEKVRGNNDGKTLASYIEKQFWDQLEKKYTFKRGSSGKGVDFPSDEINTDIKFTSAAQPQSSSPYSDATQKIYGLGYNLLLFVYVKNDQRKENLVVIDCTFIDKDHTADYEITKQILELLKNKKSAEKEISKLLIQKKLPVSKPELSSIISRIMSEPPIQGYLTISNALQWRLNYGRIVNIKKNEVLKIKKIL